MLQKNFRRFFSLTGAGFSYSSYQHPRRDLGINTNGCSTRHSVPLEGEFVFTICNCTLFNVLLTVINITKVYYLENIEQKNMLSFN